MDEKVDQFINELVQECLDIPTYKGLPHEQKLRLKEQIKNYFYESTINFLIDQLGDSQLSQLEVIEPNSPEMEEKLALFAAQIPGFIFILEEKLRQDAEFIKQNLRIPK